MRATLIGAGFVGVSTGVALAEQGHQVTLVERDKERREKLLRGGLPFYEEGLDHAYRALFREGRIAVFPRLTPATAPDVVFITVGTPRLSDGSADLRPLSQAAKSAGRLIRELNQYTVVAIKSTVPPTTTREVVAPILEQEAGGRSFGLVACPEFLREGRALEDARRPSRIVVGAFDARAVDVMKRLYASMDTQLLSMGPEAAELVKYGSNALLAVKISFANEMGNLAQSLGQDIDQVMAAVGKDPRISPHFLQAGLGFGGSCFPKDLAALRKLSDDQGVSALMLEAALEQNERQPQRAIDELEDALGDLKGRRIALLGLAFKPGTSDVRESRALAIHEALTDVGAEVICYDPMAGEEFARACKHRPRLADDRDQALERADAAVIQTAWPEFSQLDLQAVRRLMRRPIIVDGRRVLDPDACRVAGLDLRPIGNGTGRYHESRDTSRRTWNEVSPRHQERSQGNVAPAGPPSDPIRG